MKRLTSRPKAITQAELDFFRSEGYVRLHGLHSKAALGSLRAKILAELSRLNIWSKGKSAGSPLGGLPAFQQIARLSSMVKIPDLHAALSTPEVHNAIVALAGRTPKGGQGSQLLLSLPHQGGGSSANLNWHVDLASSSADEIRGMQAFYLIDDVVPRGGATLALARSHRLPDEAARRLRGSLKTPADPAEILREHGTETVEMSGRAGDVFLMDMRVLHTPSVNLSGHIRMMATTRFDLRAAG